MAHTFGWFTRPSTGKAARPAPPIRVNVWIFVVVALAVGAIFLLQVNASRSRDAVQQDAYELFAMHADTRSETRVDHLLPSVIYNRRRSFLNESFPVTLRVEAKPGLAAVTACPPPNRLQIKSRIIAPTFDAQSSLDDIVTLQSGFRHFAWMLTPHETGLAEFRVRGVVYCMSPRSVITMRQTVVDQVRAIEVVQPLAFSIDNWTTLGSALLGFIASTGALAFVRDLFHHAGRENVS